MFSNIRILWPYTTLIVKETFWNCKNHEILQALTMFGKIGNINAISVLEAGTTIIIAYASENVQVAHFAISWRFLFWDVAYQYSQGCPKVEANRCCSTSGVDMVLNDTKLATCFQNNCAYDEANSDVCDSSYDVHSCIADCGKQIIFAFSFRLGTVHKLRNQKMP